MRISDWSSDVCSSDLKKAAKRPHAFCYSTYEEKDFIQVGNTIGNAFEYVPSDIKKQGYVTSHAAFTIYGKNLVELSIILSTLHRVWADTIAGRSEERRVGTACVSTCRSRWSTDH